jgi:hypothetical protein
LKKAELRSSGSRDGGEETFMFHGTSPANTHDVCDHGFDLSLCKRPVHGKGIYLTDCPNHGVSYGDELFLCRVLPGKVQQSSPGSILT